MFAKLLLLFTLLPFAELLLLLAIAEQTSFWFTVGLILLTGIVGASLARWQGVQTVARIRRDLAAGQPPADALVDGLLILIAGALLVTPGILTDLAGFALLVPSLRKVIKRRVANRFTASLHVSSPPGAWTSDAWSRGPRKDEVIDSHIVDD